MDNSGLTIKYKCNFHDLNGEGVKVAIIDSAFVCSSPVVGSAASVHALGAQALYAEQACLSGGARVFASVRPVSSLR